MVLGRFRHRSRSRYVAIVALLAAAFLQFGCSAARVSTPPLSGTAQLSLGNSSVNFGNVAVGKTKSIPVSFTNTGSGNATIDVSQISVSGLGFNASGIAPPIQLAPGQDASMNVTFMPLSSGAVSGSISIQSTASNSDATITLTGTGTVSAGQLTVSPGSLAFGNVQVGGSESLPLSLTNPSGQSATIQVTQLNVTGSGFSVSGTTLPLTLAAGQSYTANVVFTPSSAFLDSGSLAIVSDAANPNIGVSLSGTGTGPGQLAVNPVSINFGNVTLGTSQAQNGTLSTSSGSVTISTANWNGSGFSLSGISFPLTLSSGQTAPFTARFVPQTSGSVNGTVSFVSNASNNPTVEPLTGTGVAPVQHSVALSWNASVSSVQGYYVYRSGQNGGSYTRISGLVPQLVYTDTTVASGATYYYVVTALGTDNMESGDSNQVVAIVP